MGKRKSYLYNIHRFYTFQTFDHICFGYVLGLTKALPSVGVNKAIEAFLDDFNLCESVYCFETARLQYYRILKALREKEMGEPDEEEEREKELDEL
jgi:hypothetical protein